MAEQSSISWTDATFNPHLGCVEVSPACDLCYARTLVVGRMGKQVWGKDAPRPRTSVDYWRQPEKWNRAAEKERVRRRVFCGSLCDVMEDRPDLNVIRFDLYQLIEKTPWLDWLLLTKRPQNFRRFLPPSWIESPRHNVWGMTTVESAAYMWRAVELTKTPFAIRGISAEPLLGPLDFEYPKEIYHGGAPMCCSGMECGCRGLPTEPPLISDLDWIVVGGESSGGARPMEPQWCRAIKDQCERNHVAFHFKQGSQANWGKKDFKLFSSFPPDLQVREFPVILQEAK